MTLNVPSGSSDTPAMSADGSVDASVPTDLTVTSHGDSEEDYVATRRLG